MNEDVIKFSLGNVDGDAVELYVFGRLGCNSLKGYGFVSKSAFYKQIPDFRSFPLFNSITLFSAGVWSDDGLRVEVEHLGISVDKIGNSGRLILQLRLFEEDFRHGSKVYGRGGRIDFPISYEDLSNLLDGITSVLSEDVNEFEFKSFGDW